MAAFCDPGADALNHLMYFAFCNRDETLDEAIPPAGGAAQPVAGTVRTKRRRPRSPRPQLHPRGRAD